MENDMNCPNCGSDRTDFLVNDDLVCKWLESAKEIPASELEEI